MGYIFTLFAILGTIANSFGKKICFAFWLVSNGYFITTNFLTGDYPQTILFVFNSLMAVIGYRLWKKKEAVTKKEQEKEVQN